MLADLSDSDLDTIASLTMKDASTGVVLVLCLILMVMPFLFLVFALLPERREHPNDPARDSEEAIR